MRLSYTNMNILNFFQPIKAFVFDIDGVLTDGMLLVTEEGELLRRMNIKDGYALQLAIKKGYFVWVISGGNSTAVQRRLAKLGVLEVHIAVPDKLSLLQQLMQTHHVKKEQMLYMGDDVPDIKAMQASGLPCCPADAASDVRQQAKYISPIVGGMGCARDVIEKVLRLNNDWD